MIRQCLVWFLALSTAVASTRPHPCKIQGSTWISPYNGKILKGVRGVVTARDADGLWIRGRPDHNDATSDSIYIVYPSPGDEKDRYIKEGTMISVSGSVVSQRYGVSKRISIAFVLRLIGSVLQSLPRGFVQDGHLCKLYHRGETRYFTSPTCGAGP